MSLFDAREFITEQNEILNELSDELVAKFDPNVNLYINTNNYDKIMKKKIQKNGRIRS